MRSQCTEMQIRKVYTKVNPELLYDEIRDFVQKQDVVVDQAKLETYSMPTDSSSFIYRGTLTFTSNQKSEEGKECLRAHIVGIPSQETKLIIDADDKLFSSEKVALLLEDIDLIFSSYEEQPDSENDD